MIDKQELMKLLSTLATAGSAHVEAGTRAAGVEKRKPQNIEHATYMSFKQLEEASTWQGQMDEANSNLTTTEAAHNEAQAHVLAALPDIVKKRIEKQGTLIIGEGEEFWGLYQRGKDLAVMRGEHEHNLYSKIYSYYQQAKKGGFQGLLRPNDMYR
ncbi:MAG: hypothetical protein ACRYFX_10010 [Janthinobacterium lividum]